MLAGMAEGPATIYDKAMDVGYLATNIGGGNHRLFDGGHTIAGAMKAVQGASTEDSLIQEGFGFVQGMFRDLTTSKGLPLANWDKGDVRPRRQLLGDAVSTQSRMVLQPEQLRGS